MVGVLLFGPPGVGKTHLVGQLAKCPGVQGVVCPHISSPNPGESQKILQKAFEQCAQESKLLFLDELDVLVPASKEFNLQAQRMCVELASLMELYEVLVLAATNRPHAIDPLLRRPGRFEVEVEIPPPDKNNRQNLLKELCVPFELLGNTVLRVVCSGRGLTADLVALVRTARGTKSELEWADFERSLKEIPASLKREFQVDISTVAWSDIGGLDETKRKLVQAVVWPLKHQGTFKRLGLRTPRGILLFGPPGCSKTTLAKAVAHETNAAFFTAHGASVYSAFVGESERFIRDLFARARAASPSVIFLDEVETLVGKRQHEGGKADVVQERILTTLLNEMDGISTFSTTQVLVLGATNRPDRLDAALLRPGRFDQKIYVPPPDLRARRGILDIYLDRMSRANEGEEGEIDVEELAMATEGYSGADLKHLCNEAGMIALRRSLSNAIVTEDDFEQALERTKPSITRSQLAWYEQYTSSSSTLSNGMNKIR